MSDCKVWSPSWTGIFQNRADVLLYISVRVSFCCSVSVRSVLSRCACAFLFNVVYVVLEA